MSWGLALNILIRLTLLYFLAEVVLLPDDSRFALKAIPIRNLIIVLTFSFLIPALYFLKQKYKFNFLKTKLYPFWFDNLYLSIFWLDMAGNSFNLYDSYYYFDLIPHFHSTAALTVVLFGIFGFSFSGGVGLANIIHMLLEAQEYYTDVFFKTHNVRGTSDVVNDMVVGLLGTLIYGALYIFWSKRLKS